MGIGHPHSKFIKKSLVFRPKFRFFQRERDTLHTAAKLRYMLEVLEEKGRPKHIKIKAWKFLYSREEKWNVIFATPRNELHSWVRSFLDCVQGCCTKTNESLTESQEIVQIIFNICDQKIHTYFQNTPADMSIFKSGRIKCGIDCLKSLEPEIMAFRSGSVSTSQ